MTRKVIIDCDPGIDDAVALSLAFFDPRLEVLAVTGVEGTMPADQVSRNVQTIVDQLDPPLRPRVGMASPKVDGPAIDGTLLNGEDGLGNAGFATSQLHHRHPSDKVIDDLVRAEPDEITLLCLGPLTNVALALKRNPKFASQLGRIVIAGGSVNAGGDITPAAEANVYYDPVSARMVFRSPTTKTLIPLDVSNQVALTLALVDELPPESTRAGKMLRKVLPFAFRAHHQVRGQESIYLNGVVALLFLLQPELFETEEMAGDVETRGDLTKGMTVFDRRIKRFWIPNMEVATGIDAGAARDCIVRGLLAAGRQS